jgi:hypothetical protein
LVIHLYMLIQVYLASIVTDLAFFGLFSFGAAKALTNVLILQSKG